MADLACAEDGHCSGLVRGQYQPYAGVSGSHHLSSSRPVHSYVHLNFTCQVVLLKQRTVAAAFERAIHAFSRPMDPNNESGAHQVDAGKMEAFVSHFVSSLGLARQYAMVVMNPTWSTSQPVYGYRQGLSSQELGFLGGAGGMFQVQRAMSLVDAISQDLPDIFHESFSVAGSAGGIGFFGSWAGISSASSSGGAPGGKFEVQDARASGEAWVAAVLPYLKKEEDFRSSLLRNLGGVATKASAMSLQVALAVRRLRGGPLAGIIAQEVAGEPGKLTGRFRTAHPAEDCLVANWVSKGRWLMLDLTAQSSDFGPAMGGDGVVHKHTVPRVDAYFSALEEGKKELRAKYRGMAGSYEAELKAQLKAEKGRATSAAIHEESKAFGVKREAYERASKAPGALPLDPNFARETWEKGYREAYARATLETYEAWAIKHCMGAVEPPLLCADVKADVDGLKAQLSKVAASGVTTADLFPSHMWDIFGMHNLGSDVHDYQDEGVRAHDFFMAELSAVLSRGIRHVVAPSTAAWRHGHRGAGDTAAPFSRHVRFDIYNIIESNRQAHPSSSGQPGEPATTSFDLDAFKAQVDTLRVGRLDGSWSHQVFEYKTETLNLLDSPALSAAFGASLRTSRLEIPSSEELLEGDVDRVWVDSRELLHYVRQNLFPKKKKSSSSIGGGGGSRPSPRRHHGGEGGGRWGESEAGLADEEEEALWRAEAADRDLTVVPVLVFQLDRPSPVLIDEHHSAKALEDLVLVVHNSAHAAREEEHPLGLACGGALVPRGPNAPLRDALAAVLTRLGGVLPPHLGYDPAKKAVVHDYLWSVGAHPMSATTVGLAYSDLQRDALHRSYVLDILDSSVERVNQGINLLRGAKANHLLHAHLLKNQAHVREMLKEYSELSRAWQGMVLKSKDLEWGLALDMAPAVRAHSDNFYTLAVEATKVVEHLKCKGRRPDYSALYVGPILSGSAAVAVAAGIYAVFPRFSYIFAMFRFGRPKRRVY